MMENNNQKNILFLVSSMEGGGAERVAAILCNHWSECGFKVTLMPTFSGRGSCVHILGKDVELIYLADIVNSKSKSFLMRIIRLYKLRQYIKKNKPDFIVSFLTNVNIAAIMAAIGTKIPVFVSERTYPPFNNWPILIFLLRRIFYPFASSVVMQTNDGIEWLNKSIKSSKGIVIENPVIHPLPIPEKRDKFITNKKIILAVARLSNEKNFSLIIDSFNKLHKDNPEWDLVILGDGPEKNQILNKIDKLDLKERVHLMGRSPDPDFWYSKASIFVMYSKFEGFPNALVEAMAYGLPVISSNCKTGPKDIITHMKDGLLVPLSSEPNLLTDSIEILIKDSVLRSRLSSQATFVKEKFALNQVHQKWLKLFEKNE